MLLAKKITNNFFLPVLLIVLVLSIESISKAVLEFIVVSIQLLDSNLLSYSDEFLNIVILTFTKGIGIVVLILLLNKKLRSDKFKTPSEIKFRTFLATAIIIYVGCIGFLMENLKNSLLIFSFDARIIEVWPEIILSKISIDYMGYQLFLILLLLVIMPIFEELLFRKAIIQALLKKGFRSGWIIVFPSLIYAISPFLLNIVEYSEERAIWDFVIRICSGFILAIVFLKTQKIRYPVFLRFLLNLTIYFHFLTMFHPIISQFREYFLFSLLILYSIGIFIFFYIVLDGIATLWSNSSLPPWLNSLLDFRFSKDEQLVSFIFSILIFLPLVPFGFVLFIDHTILYDDFGGSLLKTVIKIILLGTIILVCGIQIISNNTLFEAYFEPNASLKPIFRGYFYTIRKNYRDMINEVPKIFIRHSGIVILILGVICPIIFISINATVFTTIAIIFRTSITMEMASGQSPFISFMQTSIAARSDVLWMLGIQRTTEEMFYFLKHTNGKWYFLPDTFMSSPGDWFHGLVTVGTWFFFLILLYFTIHEYFKNRKIIASVLVIGVIGTELLWYFLTMGVGSTPLGDGPPTPSTNQTLSQFIEMDFEMNSFIFLPLGIILLFLAAIFILFAGIWNRRQEKKTISHTQIDSNYSDDLKDSSQVPVKGDDLEKTQ